MDYEQQIRITTPYRPGPGHFSRLKARLANGSYATGQWFYCRDLWHKEGKSVRHFLYSHAPGRGRSISAFVRRFEEQVGVPRPSRFGPTQRKTVTWVAMSSWWRTSMRRSLFTLLLRVASRYSTEKDNFFEALFSIEMTKQSRPALERFLEGYTAYRGHKRGWYNQFGRPANRPTAEGLCRLLVRPNK